LAPAGTDLGVKLLSAMDSHDYPLKN
jgi:hypothetical protein